MGETFLATVLQNLMALLPFLIVQSYQGGVRWVFGKNPKELKPGFHWKLWLVHQVAVVDMVAEAIELPTQSVMTQDKKLICFSVNIGYRVVDVVSHYCNVQDFVESTVAIAMSHLAKRVREKTMQQLHDDLDDLEKSLRGTLTTRMKDWGTEVFSVGFTNFVEQPRAFRLLTDGHKFDMSQIGKHH